MNFKNYCLIIIGGKTKDIEKDIIKISEGNVNYLRNPSFLVVTFKSCFECKEIDSLLTLHKSSFFLVDLNIENNSFNVENPKIHNGLFGFLKDIDSDFLNAEIIDADILNQMINKDILAEINSYGKDNSDLILDFNDNIKDKSIKNYDIKNMSNIDKEILWNKIMDKNIENGIKNISEKDKELLQLLSKK